MGLDLGLDIAPGLLSGTAFNANSVANLAHWIKADDLATLFQDSDKTTPVASDGDPVGAWVDQIAAEYTQGTTAAKPTYRASVAALGSKPALEFDGGDFLQGAFSGLMAQPNTFFVVAQFTDTTSGTLFDGDDGTNRNLFYINGALWRLFAGTNINQNDTDTNANIFLPFFSGASSRLWVNGVATAAAGNAGAAGIDGLTLGATNGGGVQFTGYVAELLIYNATLVADDKNTVQNYLAGKYGITVTEFS